MNIIDAEFLQVKSSNSDVIRVKDVEIWFGNQSIIVNGAFHEYNWMKNKENYSIYKEESWPFRNIVPKFLCTSIKEHWVHFYNTVI